MVLTPQQVAELKSQLVQQVQHLPEDKKNQALDQIEALSSEEIEAMLEEQQGKVKPSQKSIFRAIVSNEIPSKVIDENKSAIAVLDIKPISEGHTIIIPKTEIKDAKVLPAQVFSLAKKVAKRISSKLKSKGTEIQTEFKFGEIILNVIPIYEQALSLNSPRSELEETKGNELQQLLKAKKPRPKQKKQSITPTVKTQISLPKLQRKIPRP